MSRASLEGFGALVLCGGRSSRMGFDKALLRLPDGRPLLAALAGELEGRFGRVALACGDACKLAGVPGLERFRLIPDDSAFRGPAGAIAGGLAALGMDVVFVMAGDMPRLDWGVIEDLAALAAAGADVAVPRLGGRLEPLYAFYSLAAAGPLAQSASGGRGSLREAYSALDVAHLDLDGRDLPPDLFMNLNTPGDLARAGLAAPEDPPMPSDDDSRPQDLAGGTPEPAPGRDALLRSIPKADLLATEAAASSERLAALSGESLIAAVRGALERRRRAILGGGVDASLPWDPVPAVESEADLLDAPSLKPVINATGVVLHTNLGRAPLSFEAAENVMRVALSYTTLEYDPAAGRRTDRQRHVESLAAGIFGGESALVVNNNAAALLLISASLAAGKEIVISRGELVEIGASFRIGDILAAGGAILREVGATNRTAADDYERALADGRAAMILEVHASNFRMSGYHGRPDPAELAKVAGRRGVPWVCDLGSGSLVDLSAWLPDEPSARGRLALGADLVTMSGDKLLGASQAGLIVGRKDLLDRMRRHPLARALRIDKLSLAALEATLRLARRPREALAAVPALAMIAAAPEELSYKAERLLELIGPLDGYRLETLATEGQAGGGAAPDQALPSRAVAIAPETLSETALEDALRRGTFPVVARIWRGRLWLDVRTIAEDELEPAALAVREAASLVRSRQA